MEAADEDLAGAGCQSAFQRAVGYLSAGRAADGHQAGRRGGRAGAGPGLATPAAGRAPDLEGIAPRALPARRAPRSQARPSQAAHAGSLMYLVDTNVVSELRRPRPHGAVMA